VSMKGAATKVFDGVWETPLPQAGGAM